jgi:protein SCO1/2
MTNKRFPTGTIVIFGFFLFVMAVTYVLTKPSPPPSELLGVLRPDFKLLHPFKLTDQNGEVFDGKRFQGKWSFVFFGYTSCPDVCPTTLNVLNSVDGLLKDKAGKNMPESQIIFISVDPERDTTETLATYMSYFNKDFIGATAGKTEVDKLVRQFGAGYMFDPETAPGQYTVSHTSAIFLVDPYARLVATFSQPHYPATIASLHEKIQAYFLDH